MYRAILFLTSTLNEVGWSTPRPDSFTPRELPGNHCRGGWWGGALKAGLEGAENLAHHRD